MSTFPSPVSLGELSDLVEGELFGDPARRVSAIRPVGEAGPDDLGVLFDRRYLSAFETAAVRSVLVSIELSGAVPPSVDRLVVDDGREALRRVSTRLQSPDTRIPTVHPTAVVGRGVEMGRGVLIGPYAVVEDHVKIGNQCRIGPHVVIGRESVIGDGTWIHPHVVVYSGSVLGARVTVHAGARIGCDGFGYVSSPDGPEKIPQVGRCVIGDDVEIGANTTIDRGSLGDTVVGDRVKIDNLVHLAHNVKIGDRTMVAALVGIAGSTLIGADAWFGGQSGAIDHLKIGDGARVTVASAVLRDVPAGETVSGYPARPHRTHLRNQANLRRIEGVRARVRDLERRLALRERQRGGEEAPSGPSR